MFAVRAPLAFDGTRMLTEGATVVVEGSVIVGVEAYGVALPADLEVFDHPGGTLMPGLIDSHTHLVADSQWGALERLPGYSAEELDSVVEDSLAVELAAGVTTVRDLGDVRFCVADMRDAIRQAPDGGPLTPRLLVAGPPITTHQGHCWYMGGEVTSKELVAAVHERAERGVDVVKIMASGGILTLESDPIGAQFTAEQLWRVVDAAHDAGLPVTAHAHSLLAIHHAIEAGVDQIEHATGLVADGLGMDRATADLLAERGIVVCPTAGGDPSAMALAPPPPPSVVEMLQRKGWSMMDMFAKRYDGVRLMYQAGVTLIGGVDSGISPGKPHGRAGTVVRDLLEVGMSPVEALAAMTSVSADALGIADVTGRLREGLDADLLVVTGDPSADWAALLSPERVVAAGVDVPLPTPA